jgi:hypothetical protein
MQSNLMKKKLIINSYILSLYVNRKIEDYDDWQLLQCERLLSYLNEADIKTTLFDIAILWDFYSSDVSAQWLSGLEKMTVDRFLELNKYTCEVLDDCDRIEQIRAQLKSIWEESDDDVVIVDLHHVSDTLSAVVRRLGSFKSLTT